MRVIIYMKRNKVKMCLKGGPKNRKMSPLKFNYYSIAVTLKTPFPLLTAPYDANPKHKNIDNGE